MGKIFLNKEIYQVLSTHEIKSQQIHHIFPNNYANMEHYP